MSVVNSLPPASTGKQMMFTKTETEYNMKSIRFLLLTITTMFIMIAGIMIVLGMSVYTHFHSLSFFFESAVNGQFFTPSILCILIGMALLIVTMFGFIGSVKLSTCMVNSYAAILFAIFIVKLAVVIVAFTMDGAQIKPYLNVPIQDYGFDSEIRAEVDLLQTSLNCCGSYSFRDYATTNLTAIEETFLVSTEVDGQTTTTLVPGSCCLTTEQDRCSRVRGTGCQEALMSAIMQNAAIIGVVGVSVIFINVLGIIFALLLARCIRKVKSERAFLAWKLKEQMILARQDESQNPQINENALGIYIGKQEHSVA